ncbi:MAG TPA: sensor domain-containing diguanylate cyclase [Polyangiaceae bacterium]|jgi:diguanylate cyclase (GGDEF)-like protein
MPGEDPQWSAFLQAAFMTVLEAADEGLIVFDGDGRCRMIGRRAGELFGVEPSAHVGKSRIEVLDAFASACEEPEGFLAAAAAEAPLGVPMSMADVDVRRPRPRTVLVKGIPNSVAGRPPGRVVFVRDVTRERAAERSTRQLQARIAELTPFDTITGLLNQRRFREELEREHGRSTRAWDSYAVLRLDVDGMSAINDESGVPVGDQVLEQTASRLKKCLREYDVVARLEDDEFALLLPGADAIAARTVGDRVTKAMSERAFDLGLARRVTLSIGAALWVPPSGETPADIVKRAGNAVREARKQGGGKVHVEAGNTTGSVPPTKAAT